MDRVGGVGTAKTPCFPPISRVNTLCMDYKKLFEELRSCSDDVSAVVFWGLRDDNSWLKKVPDERNDWPLLFNGDYEPKKVFWDVVDF